MRLLGWLRANLALLYTVGVAGAFLQIAGGFWDVSWHALGIVEEFFTPPHTILYAGVAIAGAASLGGVLVWFHGGRRDPTRGPLLTGLLVAFAGGVMQGIAGPADEAWHRAYGFDPFLFTPAHALLIVGIVVVGIGMAIGAARLLQARRAGVDVGPVPSTRALTAVAVAAFATLWLGLNGLVYLLTDIDGMAYTFGLGPMFAPAASSVALLVAYPSLAFLAALVLLTAKRVLGWRWAASGVAIVVAVVMGTANVGFRVLNPGGGALNVLPAWFLALHFAFVVPVLAYDAFVPDGAARWRWLLGGALVAPFAALLDGWYSAAIWIGSTHLVDDFFVVMAIAGLAGALVQGRFESALLRSRGRPAAAPA